MGRNWEKGMNCSWICDGKLILGSSLSIEFKKKTPVSVSRGGRRGRDALWGKLYQHVLSPPFEECVHPFSNWKCSQDVYNFMDGRTPISQNLNGKTM